MDQPVHDFRSAFHEDVLVPLVGFPAAASHQVCDAAQDQAPRMVTGCHPGDGTRLPISCYCAKLGLQARDIFHQEVTVARNEQCALHVLRVGLAEPRQVYVRRIVRDRYIGIAHLLDDVVHDGLLHQDDGASLDLPLEPAARAEVDQQRGRPPVNHILRRGGRRDFAPPAVKEQYSLAVRACVQVNHEPTAERGWVWLRVGKERTNHPPLGVGRDDDGYLGFR